MKYIGKKFKALNEELQKRLVKNWRQVEYRSRKNNIEYDSYLVYDLKCPSVCPITGIDIDTECENMVLGGAEDAPSFDRIDPEEGYIKGNVRIVSFLGNRLLSNINVYNDEIKNNFIKFLKEN